MSSSGALTETSPLAELLAIGNLDEGDLVLGAQGDDELLVSLLLAGLVQDTHVSLATVEGLGSLTETAGEAVVHQSQLQDTLEGIENRHLALGGGIGRDFDLIGGDGGSVVLFYVRLSGQQLVDVSSARAVWQCVATRHRQRIGTQHRSKQVLDSRGYETHHLDCC